MSHEKIKFMLFAAVIMSFLTVNPVYSDEKVVVIPLGSDKTDPSFSSSANSPANAVFVDNAGNVGFGNLNPLSKIHANGTANYDRNGIVSANVFMGDPNPSQAIAFMASLHGNPSDTAGEYNGFVAVDTDNGGGNASFVAYKIEAGYNTAIQIQSGSIDYITGIDLNFNNGTEDVLTLTSDGKIGIGNNNPESKLSISGLPSGSTDSVTNGNLIGALCITTTGNIYIDTDGNCAN